MIAGKVVSGSPNVLIGGEKAARKSDLIDHGGLLTSGCPTVVINGALLAARVGDTLECPSKLEMPHGGGVVVPHGCATVLIGGAQAARVGDDTVCLGVTVEDSAGAASKGDESECGNLWKDYRKEAERLLTPGGKDVRERNKIISAAYADLCLRNPAFQWAGLAAYASKQVGCAMDHATLMAELGASAKAAGGAVPGIGVVPSAAAEGVRRMATYTRSMLGTGNGDLFLDIYPMHRFFEDHGFAKMVECASERNPPIPAQALDGFRALDRYQKTGDKKYLKQSVDSLAFHEQVNILQADIYNHVAMQKILRLNQTGLPGTSPADVVMNSSCSDPTGGKQTHTFSDKGRTQLYDVPERMDWILNDIAADYGTFAGSKRHKDDLEAIRRQGKLSGGTFP